MSIVVAVQKNGETIVASDSLSVFGSHREDESNLVNHRKIMRLGSSILAFTGWGLYGNIFNHYMKSRKTPPRLTDEHHIFSFFLQFLRELKSKYPYVNEQANPDNKDPFADLDSSFLVVNKNGIFGVAPNLSVSQYRNYTSIGSGCDYAAGALFALYSSRVGAEALARKAVEAAIRFDSDCGGQIVVEKV